jgi:hypothetical protein
MTTLYGNVSLYTDTIYVGHDLKLLYAYGCKNERLMKRGFSSIQAHDACASLRYHPRAAYPRAKTSSASRNSTIPSSISRQRLRTSSRQAEDRVASGPESRLSMSFSSTNARACGERERTSAMIVSMVVFMKILYTGSTQRSI